MIEDPLFWVLGLGGGALAVKQREPHRDALVWRFELTQNKWRSKLASESSGVGRTSTRMLIG